MLRCDREGGHARTFSGDCCISSPAELAAETCHFQVLGAMFFLGVHADLPRRNDSMVKFLARF